MFGQNKRPKSSPDKWYIDPIELSASIVEMRERGEMTERFAAHLLTIQEKVLEFKRFGGYDDEVKDEMRSYNQYRWVKNGWKTIKADGNPFSYITQASYFNFLTGLRIYFTAMNKQKELQELLTRENIEQMRLEGCDIQFEERII